jgi:hypothetical protein
MLLLLSSSAAAAAAAENELTPLLVLLLLPVVSCQVGPNRNAAISSQLPASYRTGPVALLLLLLGVIGALQRGCSATPNAARALRSSLLLPMTMP